MNFLAHAHLSGADEKILVGNFIGDFIKGRQALNQFEPRIIRGVELHRAIDEFTDNHPVVDESKKRLRPKYRHYAAVIVDMFYDHYLATHWAQFHTEKLETFAANTYSIIQSFSSILPSTFKQMLPYMIRGNWLISYREISGVHRALSGMAQRSPYNSRMEQASDDLRNHYDAFRLEFEQFFPQLKAFAEEWLRET
jgi:acyl carrier protein phosphodiesterase